MRSLYERMFPEPAYVNGDYAALYRQAAKPVVMFSTSTCPHCQHARDFLQQAHVDYQDFVIDQSPDAKQQFSALGGSGVPLLFIGDRRILGFREDTLRESLALIHR
jgi:glutaredoxin